MNKSSLYTFAAALAVFGLAVLSRRPPWGIVTGISILLTAGALAAGAFAARSSRSDQSGPSAAANQKIPVSLVALSATAILAVYAAGYQRTRAAAEEIDSRSHRHATIPSAPVIPAPQNALPLPAATVPAPAPSLAITPRPAPSAAFPTQPSPQPAPKSESATIPPATVATAPISQPPTPLEPASTSLVPPPTNAQPVYKDGTYVGWGRCRHGSIQASVSVEGGQILSTEITQCLTRYSCSWIAHLPGQVVTRQSPNVDYVSGATESTDAFYEAVTNALASARE